jgi:glycosyltransferase involved in cell wall biosynthesis
MKVLQVITNLAPGGAERMVVELSNLLVSKGEDVTVLKMIPEAKNETLENELRKDVKIKSLNRKSKFSLFKLVELQKLFKGYDLIHVHTRPVLRYVFLAQFFSFKCPPIVFHEHSSDKSGLTWFTKFAIKRFPLIGVSQDMVDFLKGEVNKYGGEVFLLENIVLRKEIVHNRSLVEKLEGLRLLSVGNVKPLKNQEFQIELIKGLQGKGYSVKLDIVGNISDLGYFNQLKERIKALGLEDNIAFRQSVSEIQKILCEYDLAIHSAYRETGPLVLIEYLSQGLPFLAYKVGQAALQIKEDIPEFIMEDFDEAAWCQQILNMLEQKNEHLKKRIDQSFEKNFSPSNYYNKCKRIYQEVIPC